LTDRRAARPAIAAYHGQELRARTSGATFLDPTVLLGLTPSLVGWAVGAQEIRPESCEPSFRYRVPHIRHQAEDKA
jgi:hypothetical protein